MSNSIRVDPEKVIRRLVAVNGELTRSNVMIEIAYEELAQELAEVRQENEGLKAQLADSATVKKPSTQ